MNIRSIALATLLGIVVRSTVTAYASEAEGAISLEEVLGPDFYTELPAGVIAKELDRPLYRIGSLCRQEPEQRTKMLNESLREIREIADRRLPQNLSVHDQILLGGVEGVANELLIHFRLATDNDEVTRLDWASQFGTIYAVHYGLPDCLQVKDFPHEWAKEFHRGLACVGEWYEPYRECATPCAFGYCMGEDVSHLQIKPVDDGLVGRSKVVSPHTDVEYVLVYWTPESGVCAVDAQLDSKVRETYLDRTTRLHGEPVRKDEGLAYDFWPNPASGIKSITLSPDGAMTYRFDNYGECGE